MLQVAFFAGGNMVKKRLAPQLSAHLIDFFPYMELTALRAVDMIS